MDDFIPGDPARHIIGKPEEKPARVHSPQKPKPARTGRMILADIRLRLQELEPLVKEYEPLVKADEILSRLSRKSRI